MLSLRAVSAALITTLLVVSAVSAKDGDGRVERSGSCTGVSNWELKAKPDDGKLEVEFEVDQNKNGVRWTIVLRRNGSKVREGSRMTQPPSGSFEFRARLRNGAGEDRIKAVARRANGERCRGVLRI